MVKPSSRQGPGFKNDAARTFTAGAFSCGASLYHDARPSYPTEVRSLVRGGGELLDIGAGTGKLTELLLADAHHITALEPSPDMAQVLANHLPGVGVVRATAETLPFADAQFSTITCAQTWHWLDVEAASREAARVATPDARLVLVWNTLDVTHPWVLRYSRISHSGDVHREGFYPTVGQQWRLVDELRTKWLQPTTPEELISLMRTRSYWLRANDTTRDKVETNLHWYLYERLGFSPGQVLPLPYRTDAFAYERR